MVNRQLSRSLLRGNAGAISTSISNVVAAQIADETSTLHSTVSGIAASSPYILQSPLRAYDSRGIAAGTISNSPGITIMDYEVLFAPIVINISGMGIARVGFNVVTAEADSQAKLGLYSFNTDPTIALYGTAFELIQDFGAVATTTTGKKSIFITAENRIELTPGHYWLGITSNTYDVLVSSFRFDQPVFGFDETMADLEPNTGGAWSQGSSTFEALPVEVEGPSWREDAPWLYFEVDDLA